MKRIIWIVLVILMGLVGTSAAGPKTMEECLRQYEGLHSVVPVWEWYDVDYEPVAFLGYDNVTPGGDTYHWDLPGVTDQNWRYNMVVRYMDLLGDDLYVVYYESRLYPDSLFLFVVKVKDFHCTCQGFKVDKQEAMEIICAYEPNVRTCPR